MKKENRHRIKSTPEKNKNYEKKRFSYASLFVFYIKQLYRKEVCNQVISVIDCLRCE